MLDLYCSNSFLNICSNLGIPYSDKKAALEEFNYKYGGSDYLQKNYPQYLSKKAKYKVLGNSLLEILKNAQDIDFCAIQTMSGWLICLGKKEDKLVFLRDTGEILERTVEEFSEIPMWDSIIVFKNNSGLITNPLNENIQGFLKAYRSGQLANFSFSRNIDSLVKDSSSYDIDTSDVVDSLEVDLADEAAKSTDELDIDLDNTPTVDDQLVEINNTEIPNTNEVDIVDFNGESLEDDLEVKNNVYEHLITFLQNKDNDASLDNVIAIFTEPLVKSFIDSGQGFVFKGKLITY